MEIYLAEIVVFIVVIIVSYALLKNKNKKGYHKILAVILGTLLITLGIEIYFQNPEIDISSIEGEIEVSSINTISLPKSQYFMVDITDKLEVENNIEYDRIGEYDIVFKYNTLHGVYETKKTVKVVDKTAPEIVLEGEEVVNISYTKQYEEQGYKAIDNFEGDLTEKVKITKEEISETEYNIKYEVTDESGNTVSKIRKIVQIDDIPPEITINGKKSETILLNSNYQDKGAIAVDEKEGDLTDKIQIEGNVNTAKVGTYTITYTVADSKGNVAKKTRTIKVYEPQIQSPIDTTGEAGTIYLTFDDGPTIDITPKVLDILKQKNIKATFFILNYSDEKEYLVKREIEEGHSVGIHGYSHDYAKIYQSDESFMNNITTLKNKIYQSTGYNTSLMRFPGGSSNTVSKKYNTGIMSRLTKTVLEQGYKYYDWNISSGDAGGAHNSYEVYNNVTKALKKGRDNVVLLHDFSNNTKTLNALSDIIDYGMKNGYTFSNITENTPMVTHNVNN